jgi:hypothetical protein
MAKITRSKPRDDSPLSRTPTADAKVKAESQRASSLTPMHEAIVRLLAEAFVNDYLSETKRRSEARPISKHKQAGGQGQEHPT